MSKEDNNNVVVDSSNSKIKHLGNWSKKEFEALPARGWNEDIGLFDSLIILPTNRMHDSGYKCIDFVSVLEGVPKWKLSGCSDVLHINGIGGLGYNWLEKNETVPKEVSPIS